MTKILFVCHGSICRSPMAEFIFGDLVKKANLEASFLIESAAVSREELGNPVYPPARRVLAKLYPKKWTKKRPIAARNMVC